VASIGIAVTVDDVIVTVGRRAWFTVEIYTPPAQAGDADCDDLDFQTTPPFALLALATSAQPSQGECRVDG
jgi:hypothetical protein